MLGDFCPSRRSLGAFTQQAESEGEDPEIGRMLLEQFKRDCGELFSPYLFLSLFAISAEGPERVESGAEQACVLIIQACFEKCEQTGHTSVTDQESAVAGLAWKSAEQHGGGSNEGRREAARG